MDTILFLVGFYGLERTKDSLVFLYNCMGNICSYTYSNVYNMLYPPPEKFVCECCSLQKIDKVTCGCNICVKCVVDTYKNRCLSCMKEDVLTDKYKEWLNIKLQLLN